MTKPAIVLVHGAFHGGWCYRKVDDVLSARGYRVYRPTLTGLSDRSHLLKPEIDLYTHADDVINLAKYEDLDDIVLCGHSYGGAVITAAAEGLDGRLRSMVFLDALVPTAGKTILEEWPAAQKDYFDSGAAAHGGHYLPPIAASVFKVIPSEQAWVDRNCTLQPYQTFKTKIKSTAVRDKHKRKIYVFASGYNSPLLGALAERERGKPDWEVVNIDAGHDVMVDAPEALADVLVHAAR